MPPLPPAPALVPPDPLFPRFDRDGCVRRLFEARRRVGEKFALQGNMDPFALYASPEHIRGEVRRMIDETGGRGHIVNLGHGITPDAPVEGVAAFIDAVVNAKIPKML